MINKPDIGQFNLNHNQTAGKLLFKSVGKRIDFDAAGT